MTGRQQGGGDEFARTVQAWLTAEATITATPDLEQAVMVSVRATRQRARWLAGLGSNQGWGGLGLTLPMAGRGLRVLAIVMLVALTGLLVISAGHQVRRPAPLGGLARNGLLAFVAGAQIVVMNADGSGRMVITHDGAAHSTPLWSPDGTHLAFWTRSAVDGTLSLTVVDPDGGSVTIASGTMTFSVPSTQSHDAIWPTPANWSPDGSRLPFTAIIGQVSRIVVATLDGRPPSQIGDPALPALTPVWSPDGRLIAFAGGRNADAGLYVMRADGSDVRRLTTFAGAPGSFIEPGWSPDGSRLVYPAGANTDDRAIWQVGLDGSGEVMLGLQPEGWTDALWPAWSPDGRLIAFVRTRKASRPGETCTVRLPACSPGADSGSPQVFVIRSDGSGEVQVSHGLIDEAPLHWAPDAMRVIAISADLTAPGLVLIDPSGQASPAYVPTPGAGSSWASWERLAP